METRKVYLSGGSTYVVSLPKKWVVEEDIKQGDVVSVTTQKGSLIIEPGIKERELAEIELEVSQVPSNEALERLLIAHYLTGYDIIKIKLESRNQLDCREIARKTLNLLIGAEMVEDTGDSITMEVLLDHKRMPTVKALRRINLICKSMLTDTIKALKNKDTDLASDIMIREREIDRLYFFVVRQLKGAVRYQRVAEKLGIENQRDCLGYRIIVKSSERIADHIENIAQNFLELVDTDKSPNLSGQIELASSVVSIYEKANLAVFKRDIRLVEEVLSDLKEIKEQHRAASNRLFEQKISVRSAILQKAILDSLDRIASYSSDIAEIAMNMSVKVPGS
ncbi:MAG: PhoU domain-containing protein [Candidatus Hydrothermarchaeales archaeon]